MEKTIRMSFMPSSRGTKREPLEKMKGPRKGDRGSPSGYTLIEMIFVIGILSILSAITLSFFVASARLYVTTMGQKALFDEGKLALERMCREIRDAKAVLSPAAGASGTSITFVRTHATAQDSANEAITIRLSGTTLEKVKATPSTVSPMADRVSVFLVTRSASDEEIKIVFALSGATGENILLQTKVYPKNVPKSATHKHYYENWSEEISP